jgi:uncharacterized protein
MNQSRNALRLNVGFLINQSVGNSREFPFEFPALRLEPDLDLQNLSGSARITRTPQGLLVQVKMLATLLAECSRCLIEIEQPLGIEFTELYAFTPRTVSESGLILPEDGNIDLTPLVREYMLLEIPISVLCTQDCLGLCPECGERLTDNPHDHREESIDPRLVGLKKLLDNEQQE